LTAFTIAQALTSAQTVGLDRLDAQLLLLHALGRPDTERAWLLAHDTNELPQAIADVFRSLSLRRAAGEPLAYIVGYKEFFGLRLNVNPAVLVPRPDTETLVQWALTILTNVAAPELLDLGTGSGAVAIAVAHSLVDKKICKVTATDFSESALAVALQNARQLGVDVRFFQSDWLEKVSGHYHIITSNPPYIASTDPHLAALTHEPMSALAAGTDGLSDIRQIVQQAPRHLYVGGWLLLEHGYDQASAVCKLLEQRGFNQVQSRMDLAGIARCSGGQWQNSPISYPQH
jgi:release factor glutamine methyltransferase